jgi:hypothetical protein
MMPATVRCRRIPRLELLPTVWDQDASARIGTREIHWRVAAAVARRGKLLKQMLRRRCDASRQLFLFLP